MSKSCCFLGHRIIETDRIQIDKLYCLLEKLITEEGVVRFLFGSNSQFITLCHEIITNLKAEYPNIVRIAYRTLHEQPTLAKDKVSKEHMLSKILHREVNLPCYEEIVTPKKVNIFGKASYIERNQKMIDDSDFCIFYFDNSYIPSHKKITSKLLLDIFTSKNSGTQIAMKYAIRKHKIIFNISDIEKAR